MAKPPEVRVVRLPPKMPRKLSDVLHGATVALADGVIAGQVSIVHPDGRVAPINPRPWHSYRRTQRRLLRPVLQRLCHRKIDPAANLAFLKAQEERRQALLTAVKAAQDAEIAELEHMKRLAA